MRRLPAALLAVALSASGCSVAFVRPVSSTPSELEQQEDCGRNRAVRALPWIDLGGALAIAGGTIAAETGVDPFSSVRRPHPAILLGAAAVLMVSALYGGEQIDRCGPAPEASSP